MKKRTSKVLSLLLAASMVFSMNTMAFGEEQAADSKAEADLVTYSQEDWDDYDNFIRDKDGKKTTKVTRTPDEKKGMVVTLSGVTDPVSWNKTTSGKTLMATVLKADLDTYLVNKSAITVSQDNYEGVDGLVDAGNAFYDVVPLDAGYYLFVSYSGTDGQYFVEGVEEKIPVFTYTGQKFDYNKSGLHKATKSRAEALDVSVALVKYENGTVTTVPGASVAAVKVDKKHAKDASVSGQAITVVGKKTVNGKEYAKLEYEEYKKTGELPTFTISVKAKDDAKAQAKTIKTALKSKTYQFAINQKVVSVWNPGNMGSRTIYKDGKPVVEDYAYYAGNVDQDTVNYSDIVVSKFNSKNNSASIVSKIYDWNDNEIGEAKMKAGTDYELGTGTVGGTTVSVITEFKGNYIYSYDNNDYKYAFRVSPKDEKKIRKGVYKADGEGYVYSVD